MGEQASIALDGVTYAYGTQRVLNGLDLRIDQGVTGLLGPNGAGKSTLLNLMATVAYPLTGEIAVAGEPLTTERQRDRARRRLGFLPQRFDAFPNFSTLEVVEYVARLRGVPGRNARSLSRDALRLVGLEDRATSKFRGLSGGQQRRVGIAQAIVQEPSVLILDEPTVGLDPGQRLAFRALVRELGERSAILLSTHLTEDVAATCSRVIVLDGGRIRFDGPPADLSHLGGPETRDDAETAMERGYQAVLSESRIDSGMMASPSADWR